MAESGQPTLAWQRVAALALLAMLALGWLLMELIANVVVGSSHRVWIKPEDELHLDPAYTTGPWIGLAVTLALGVWVTMSRRIGLASGLALGTLTTVTMAVLFTEYTRLGVVAALNWLGG